MQTDLKDDERLGQLEDALNHLTALIGKRSQNGSAPGRSSGWEAGSSPSSHDWVYDPYEDDAFDDDDAVEFGDGADFSDEVAGGVHDGRLEAALLSLIQVLTTLNTNITTLAHHMRAYGPDGRDLAANGKEARRYAALLAKYNDLRQKYNDLLDAS